MEIAMLVGYARVSSQDQNLTAQIAELTAAGCAKIYSEKVSGAQSNRKELQKVLNKLQEGDVLVISRLDRLARSTRDLLNILDSVSHKGAGFRSLHDPWIDTSTPHGRLIITVLSGLAEFEREQTRADGAKITCPLLAIWGGAGGIPAETEGPLATWREWATDVRGFALDSGHYLAEEAPEATAHALIEFFTAG
jgi:pimeloyl-ACP methyl ester carboxylesterase